MALRNDELDFQKAPNNACTRLVGRFAARFQAIFVARGWFRQSGVVSSRPPAGNANRWAPNTAAWAHEAKHTSYVPRKEYFQ